MSELRCPTCGTKYDSEHSSSLPFCSRRCRDVDLGRWLNEQVGLPIDPEDEQDEQEEQGGPPKRDPPPGEVS